MPYTYYQHPPYPSPYTVILLLYIIISILFCLLSPFVGFLSVLWAWQTFFFLGHKNTKDPVYSRILIKTHYQNYLWHKLLYDNQIIVYNQFTTIVINLTIVGDILNAWKSLYRKLRLDIMYCAVCVYDHFII